MYILKIWMIEKKLSIHFGFRPYFSGTKWLWVWLKAGLRLSSISPCSDHCELRCGKCRGSISLWIRTCRPSTSGGMATLWCKHLAWPILKATVFFCFLFRWGIHLSVVKYAWLGHFFKKTSWAYLLKIHLPLFFCLDFCRVVFLDVSGDSQIPMSRIESRSCTEFVRVSGWSSPTEFGSLSKGLASRSIARRRHIGTSWIGS